MTTGNENTLKNEIEKLKAEKLELLSEITSLKQSAERFEGLFRDAPLPYQSLDINGKIIDVNNQWLKEFNYAKSEVLNHSISEFVDPNYLEKFLLDFSNFKKTGFIKNLEQVIITKEGKRINVLVDGTACYDESGKFKHTHCILRDITNLKLMQKELKKNIREKDKFFSIVAHDLRNPIIGFVGLTKMLVDDFPELTLAEINELIEAINNSALNLNQLLENLLEWSRLQRNAISFNPVKCNLKELIDEILLYQKVNLNLKKIKALNKIKPEIFIKVDVNMISSVMNNLISNAIKFSYENSEIIIDASINQNNIKICVKDFGVGIEEHNIKKLFKLDEHYTSLGTEKEKGTGLGLMLAKDHLKKHGSDLKVNSKFGEGSEFSFTLPLVKEENH